MTCGTQEVNHFQLHLESHFVDVEHLRINHFAMEHMVQFSS
jgi:hypothetical protein